LSRLFGKSILFVLIGATILLPVCILSSKTQKNALESSVFRVGNDVTVLIVGDSHTETSINPAYLPGSINISKTAENYFYTYYKLRHFFRLNPQIDTVVLSCSPHNLTKFQDKSVYQDRFNQWKEYFPLFDATTERELFSTKMSYLVSLFQYHYGVPFRLYQNDLLIKMLLDMPYKKSNFAFYGGYLLSTNSDPNLERIKKRAWRHFNDEGNGYAGLSDLMVDYLFKIADLCREHRVKLILLSTPLSSLYRDQIPLEAIQDFQQTLNELTATRTYVRYVDISTLELPNSSYQDGNHVNWKGTKIVTSILLRTLQ